MEAVSGTERNREGGDGEGEGDGGAGLMIGKLQRSQARARGNRGTSGTGSVHPEVVICDPSAGNQFDLHPRGFGARLFYRGNIHMFDKSCALRYCWPSSKVHHVFLDGSLPRSPSVSINFPIE